MFDDVRKFFNTASEGIRTLSEWAGLQASWRWIRISTPDGDGHPVLLLPGFLTGDMTTAPLRECLDEKGYKTYTWNGGINLGLNDHIAEHLHSLIQKIFEENKGQKITLIGHSLGGVFARELAREYPEMIRSVITLGTPFGAAAEATPQLLRKIYEFLNPGSDHLNDKDLQLRGLTPPPVPTTSVFSKSDGIVDWQASLNPKAMKAENIEVISSHIGMIVNPLAIAAILDRLAQKEGQWQPFDASKYHAVISALYPSTDGHDLPENPQWSANVNSKPLFRKDRKK